MIVTIFSLFKHLRKLRESSLLTFAPMFSFPSFTCKMKHVAHSVWQNKLAKSMSLPTDLHIARGILEVFIAN